MKKLLIILGFIFTLYNFNYAQINVSLPDTTFNQTSDTLKIPINVVNFNDVGAISLEIKYDTTAMTFDTAEDNIGHGTFIANATGGIIYISWFDINPVSISNGALLNLIFNGVKTNSSLQFLTSSCEIANSVGTPQSVTYKNGSVSLQVLPVTFGGTVWLDSNGNGIKDPGEKGVQWITVDLWNGSNNQWMKWTLTDSAGHFSFPGLAPGKYFVDYILVGYNKSYQFCPANVGNDPTVYSHAILENDSVAKTIAVSVTSGESYNYANAGLELKGVTAVNNVMNNNSNPTEYSLMQNYPNPFNPSTTITYDIPQSGYVSLKVYDILGNEVATLVNGYKSAGEYRQVFNMNNAGRSIASGIYFYRLESGNFVSVRKMILTK